DRARRLLGRGQQELLKPWRKRGGPRETAAAPFFRRYGLKTKPGPIATADGIGGRSLKSCGCSRITFTMYFGSMCLFTSKVDFRKPPFSSFSCAAHSAR